MVLPKGKAAFLDPTAWVTDPVIEWELVIRSLIRLSLYFYLNFCGLTITTQAAERRGTVK